MSESIADLLRDEAVVIEAEGATGESVDLLIDAADEITTLRQQLAKSEQRVAEFNQLMSGSSEAYVLRKQAEALIDAHNAMSDSFVLEATGVIQERAIIRCQDFLNNYAQRLRNQADEAERAGGEHG